MRIFLHICVLGAALISVSCSREGQAAFPVRTVAMGDRAEVGHLIYQVFETRWETQLPQEPTPRVPKNRFFLVRLSALNNAGNEVMLPTLSLQDDAGNLYEELNNGEGVPQWTGFLRQIKPADTIQGNVVFDVPPKHYKLRVTDENGERVGLVDIPLNFNAETPEVPIPGEKK